MPRFNLDEYIPVQERINQFWAEYPDGAIRTRHMGPVENFKETRYLASVYANRADAEPVATGWAFEIAGGNSANATSHEENCETSAIGRALANLGYATTQANRPSREEMEKVERMSEPVRMEPRQRQQVDATYEQVSRQHSPAPSGGPQVPDVARIHGVTTMVGVNDYLQSNGFRGGNKGEVIRELEATYKTTIQSPSGKRDDYGNPQLFPSDIYNFAHFHISRANAEPMALEQ